MIGTLTKLAAYAIGQIIHITLQADAVKRSSNNPTPSYGAFLRLNGVRLAARLFACTMLFIFWWNNPATLVEALAYIGWNIPDKIGHVLSLPMTVPTAGMFGLACDALLSFIPGLKSVIPKVEE